MKAWKKLQQNKKQVQRVDIPWDQAGRDQTQAALLGETNEVRPAGVQTGVQEESGNHDGMSSEVINI